jgi:hypothetical protein
VIQINPRETEHEPKTVAEIADRVEGVAEAVSRGREIKSLRLGAGT